MPNGIADLLRELDTVEGAGGSSGSISDLFASRPFQGAVADAGAASAPAGGGFSLDLLRRMSPEQAEQYIRENYTYVEPTWEEGTGFGEAATGDRLILPENWQGGRYGGKGDADAGFDPTTNTVYFESFDPDRDYIASFDDKGKLVDLNQQLGSGWYGQEIGGIPIGAFLPVAAAVGGAYLPELLSGAGTGVTEAALGELGINTALPAGTAGGVSGITEAALGELGINTSLPMGAEGGVYGPSGIESLVEPGVESTVLEGSAPYDIPEYDIPPGAEPQVYDVPTGPDVLPPDIPPGAEPQVYDVPTGPDVPPATTPPATVPPSIPPGAEPQVYGVTPGMTDVGAAVAPASGVSSLMRTLGVNSVYDALKLGMLGAGAVSLLTGGNRSGGGGTTGGGGLANLVTPTTFTRTVNPQATPLTSKDAYAYLRGEPSPTTGKAVSTGQQNWFNDKFTQQDTYNPVTGEQFVKDPTSGQFIPLKDIQAAQAQVDANKSGDTATGADGGIVALARGGHYSDMLDGSTLGSYSDGGRLLRGPGDGVSDSIPATIAGKHPARLADGEFVIPARIVSELGNGSTEAGARKLYQMMDRIQAGRRKTVGKNSVAKDSKSDKHLPA